LGALMGARSARIIVASTRASDGVYTDECGPIIAEWLEKHGFSAAAPVVVADGNPVGEALHDALDAEVDVILTTGGTGISPTDSTPDQTVAVVDYMIPGLADAIRHSGLPKVPTSVLSRGVCGVAGKTLIVNLPGSPGGVRDGLGVLADVLDHALDQIAGKDHQR
jgi:molybdenum cofactor synthesis domain-containing protein